MATRGSPAHEDYKSIQLQLERVRAQFNLPEQSDLLLFGRALDDASDADTKVEAPKARVVSVLGEVPAYVARRRRELAAGAVSNGRVARGQRPQPDKVPQNLLTDAAAQTMVGLSTALKRANAGTSSLQESAMRQAASKHGQRVETLHESAIEMAARPASSGAARGGTARTGSRGGAPADPSPASAVLASMQAAHRIGVW